MGLVRTMLSELRNVEDPRKPLTAASLADLLDAGSGTAAGVSVTPEKALGLTAFYSAISLIADTVGTFPVDVAKKDGRFRRPVDNHPLASVLTEEPNPEQDAGEFWRLLTAHMLTRGNAYVLPQRGPDGRISALWPVPPWAVKIVRLPDRSLAYTVNLTGEDVLPPVAADTTVGFLGHELWHYRAFGTRAGYGLSPIQNAKESIGSYLAAVEYAGRFYSQDARPGGIVQVPTELTDEAWKRLKGSWEKMHQGAKNAHLVAILENGAQWQQVGLSPEDAQMVAVLRWGVEEAARIYRVPLPLLSSTEKSTTWGTGLEQQTRGFVTFSVANWTSRLERVTTRNAFREERGTFLRFRMDALLRGDTKTRYEAYRIGREGGWLSPDDIRALEDLEPIGPENGGDTYLQPMNMQPSGEEPDDNEPAEPAEEPGQEEGEES